MQKRRVRRALGFSYGSVMSISGSCSDCSVTLPPHFSQNAGGLQCSMFLLMLHASIVHRACQKPHDFPLSGNCVVVHSEKSWLGLLQLDGFCIRTKAHIPILSSFKCTPNKALSLMILVVDGAAKTDTRITRRAQRRYKRGNKWAAKGKKDLQPLNPTPFNAHAISGEQGFNYKNNNSFHVFVLTSSSSSSLFPRVFLFALSDETRRQ